MSHIVSLRSASLRALRSSSTAINAATRSTTYPHRSNLHQQQYSYSTFPPSPNRMVLTENNKFIKRVNIEYLENDSDIFKTRKKRKDGT